MNNDTASDATNAAAATADGSSSSLSLYSPVYSRLSHQTSAGCPANRLPHLHEQQQPEDHIPRSHERQRHPYWAVESIRQALSMPGGRQSPSSHSRRHTPSSTDTAAGAGVVASGNGEMRDQATNTDITSECKLLSLWRDAKNSNASIQTS